MSSTRREFVIDGTKITDRASFYDEISRVVLPDVLWGRNLDALNDILTGGFGTPEEGFVLRWVNSSASKAALGSDFLLIVETIRDHGPKGDYSESKINLVLD